MLISHSKKFIFIHTYKVAGSSIRDVLNPYSCISWKQSPIPDLLKIIVGMSPPIFSSKFNGHITAQELKANIPNNVFDAYYKFAFVRNPWDWQLSLYQFGLKDTKHFQHKLFKSFKNFDEYLDWRIHNELKLQKSFIVDENNNFLVDFVGKFENLNQDFKAICNKINIPQQDLPHLNISKKAEYQSFYNTKTIAWVEEAFKDDIKLFNYKF
jgi:hypothetical protein